MATYIALLRGINVAGHKPVAMADLRSLCTDLGFQDSRTILQSGNLVFRCRSKPSAKLARVLEAETEKRLGLRTDYFVRTAKEWEDIVARNPFKTEAKRDPGRLVVIAFTDAPDAKRRAALSSVHKGPELVRFDGKQAYIVYPDGIGRSKLTHAVIEKTLGARATGRNWNTVMKLAAVAGE